MKKEMANGYYSVPMLMVYWGKLKIVDFRFSHF